MQKKQSYSPIIIDVASAAYNFFVDIIDKLYILAFVKFSFVKFCFSVLFATICYLIILPWPLMMVTFGNASLLILLVYPVVGLISTLST